MLFIRLRLRALLGAVCGVANVDAIAHRILIAEAASPLVAFHAYPWLIHRLTCRRTNHDHIHERGYKEEGTITTPFDMTARNELDRFYLVMGAGRPREKTGHVKRADDIDTL